MVLEEYNKIGKLDEGKKLRMQIQNKTKKAYGMKIGKL